MKTSELKAARVRLEKTSAQMADAIGKTEQTYRKKECGAIRFTPDEIVTVANELGLSLDDVNAIFFDSKITEQ